MLSWEINSCKVSKILVSSHQLASHLNIWIQLEQIYVVEFVIDLLIIYCFMSRSRIFHLYEDVTIAGEGLQNLVLCSTLRAFEQGRIFIVPHLLWHVTSVFPVSSEGLPHSVASYDMHRDEEDLFKPGSSRRCRVCENVIQDEYEFTYGCPLHVPAELGRKIWHTWTSKITITKDHRCFITWNAVIN
jgi:hypothetical protein